MLAINTRFMIKQRLNSLIIAKILYNNIKNKTFIIPIILEFLYNMLFTRFILSYINVVLRESALMKIDVIN